MAKKLTPFRITPEALVETLRGSKTTFTTLPSGKTIVCETVLKNGFAAVGISHVIDKRNFNAKLGKQIALDRATEQVCQFMSYGIHISLSESQNVTTPARRKPATKASLARVAKEIAATAVRGTRVAKKAAVKAPVKRVPTRRIKTLDTPVKDESL